MSQYTSNRFQDLFEDPSYLVLNGDYLANSEDWEDSYILYEVDFIRVGPPSGPISDLDMTIQNVVGASGAIPISHISVGFGSLTEIVGSINLHIIDIPNVDVLSFQMLTESASILLEGVYRSRVDFSNQDDSEVGHNITLVHSDEHADVLGSFSVPHHQIYSGAGDDVITLVVDEDTPNQTGFILSGAGDDVIQVVNNLDDMEAGMGSVLVSAGDGDDFVSGGNAVFGDTISGGAGNDEIYGNGGDDILDGGANDDFIIGGAGSDVIEGGAGNDILYGDDPVFTSGEPDQPAFEALVNEILDISQPISLLDFVGNSSISSSVDRLDAYSKPEQDEREPKDTRETIFDEFDSFGDRLLDGDLEPLGDADIFVFNELGANNADTIMDFDVLEGDAIDLSSIISGFDANDDILDFIQLTEVNGSTVVSVDGNGASGGSNYQEVVTLNGVTGLDAADLVTNGNLIL